MLVLRFLVPKRNHLQMVLMKLNFLVSMNPGQDFSSLSVSASGGELSRLMLALKVVFQASNGIETIIFDEIDTGVSGKVALAMGAKMKALSNKYPSAMYYAFSKCCRNGQHALFSK